MIKINYTKDGVTYSVSLEELNEFMASKHASKPLEIDMEALSKEEFRRTLLEDGYEKSVGITNG